MHGNNKVKCVKHFAGEGKEGRIGTVRKLLHVAMSKDLDNKGLTVKLHINSSAWRAAISRKG